MMTAADGIEINGKSPIEIPGLYKIGSGLSIKKR
jgi:hypothetical protein